MRVAVADLAASEALLRENGLATQRRAGMAIVEPAATLGTLIAFVGREPA
jgi:hypothetical protein